METLSRVICDLHRDLRDIKNSIPRDKGDSCPTATWDQLVSKIAEAEKVLKLKAAEAIQAADKKNCEKKKETPTKPLDYSRAREKYNVHATSSERLKPRLSISNSRVVKARTTGPRRMLPVVNRNDPLAHAPKIHEDDLDEGLFPLVNKGFVPAAADLTPAFQRGVPCMKQEPMHFYHSRDKNYKKSVQPTAYPVKLDLNEPVFHRPKPVRRLSAPSRRTHSAALLPLPPIPQSAPSGENIFCTEVMEDETPFKESRPRSPPTRVASSLPNSRGDLLIRYGSLFADLDELQESFDTNWPVIWWMLQRLLHLLREVPIAFIITEKLVAILARDIVSTGAARSLASVPHVSDVDLIECVRDGEAIVQQYQHSVPGLRFLLGNRKKKAATYIKATWKMIQMKREFAQLKARNDAAYCLQQFWTMLKFRWATREQIHERQDERQKTFRRIQCSFAQNWEDMHGSRVEIHVCSSSIDECRRGGRDNYQARQTQLGRLFRIASTRCSIIYVTPREIHSDLLDYFWKIMAFRGLDAPEVKIQFIVPENTPGRKLPAGISLTSALLYSPLALKRIRSMLKNQEDKAMLVFGASITPAEVDLAVHLNVPIYGCDPKNIDLLCTKSAHQRLLAMADIRSPPQGIDIYDVHTLFVHLSSLIVAHPHISQWAIKLDDEAEGRGTAVLETRGMFNGEDAETIRQVLQKQAPKRMVLPKVYNTWASYCAQIDQVGCVVQAMPDDIESYPSIHCRIDPNANVSILGTSEHLVSLSTEIIATFYPQKSLPREVIDDMGYRLGRMLATKGVCGFFSIDLVCFRNPEYEEKDTPAEMFAHLKSPSPDLPEGQAWMKEEASDDYRAIHLNNLRNPFPKMVWVVDIDFGISPSMSMLWPMEFVGQLESLQDESGSYGLAPHAPTYKEGLKQERVCIAFPPALSPSLERLNCQTAFQLLKSNGQSYDLWANMGAIILHLDVYAQLFSALVLANTREQCVYRSVKLLQALMSHGEPVSESKELLLREILSAMKTMERRTERARQKLDTTKW